MIKIAPMQIFKKSAFILLILGGCQLLTSLEKRLLSDDDKVRDAALLQVPDLPLHKKEKLVGALQEYLIENDSRRVNRAADALVAIGEPSVPTLIQRAQDGNDIYARLVAIDSLRRLALLSRPALPVLIGALQDPHPLIREEAARSIGTIGDRSPNVLQALQTAANSDNVDTVRFAASEALKALEPADSPSGA